MKELALTQEHHQQLAHDEQELTSRPLLRRAARARERDAANQGSTAPGGDVGVAGLFSQAINAGLGHALPDNLRETFETSLGTSLSDVRVHTDGHAAASADAFDAHAFAHGQNIFFGAGQYRPGTPDGDQLIAHEVAHTVQQRGAAPTTQHKLAISEAGDAMEHAADAAAVAMTRGERTGVGSAGLTIARQSRGAAAPQRAANAAGGAQTIAQRFPQGITVAVALRPSDVEEVASRVLSHHEMLGVVMHRNRAQLIEHPATTRLQASLRAGDHPVTPQDAHDIATVLAANDGAFARAASAFAQGHVVVGGEPSAPAVGRPILFGEHDNAVEMVRTLSSTVGRLPSGTDTGNIRHLAIFTHGWHDGLRLGTFRGGAAAFVAALGGALTHDVTVGMYGCSAASGEHSFAQNVTEGLAQGGHDVRVFGHENAAHTTGNPRGREFLARAGQSHADSNTNYELVFAAGFRGDEISRIARELSVPRPAVEQVFDNAACEWMVGSERVHAALPRIHAQSGSERVAFQMGYDPREAVRPIRATWTNEGVAVIRRALASPAAASRDVTNTHVGRDAALNGLTWDSEAQSSAGGTPAAPDPRAEDRSSAPVEHATVAVNHTSAPASRATTREASGPATPTRSQKPAMDPHAKDKAPMAPHATDPAAPSASAPANTAPTAAAPTAAEGPLAIVQRAGDLRPRHPGDGMAVHAAADTHSAASEHIPAGTFVRIVRREGDWTLVSHRGNQGYVASANIHEASLGQQDVRDEAEYHLAAAETRNNAAQYTADSARVNIGLGSWTGGRIGRLLERYRRFAEQRGQVEALYSHFVNREHFDDLVHRFWNPDMSERIIQTPEGRRTWNGPQLDSDEITQFRTLEADLPFVREADQDQIHSDVNRYLGWLGRSAYPFIGADRTVSEAALNVAISAYHQGGMHIAAANAHFGEPVHEHTTELEYLTYLGSLVHPHTQGRYRQIVSQYADSPRRYPVP